MVAYKLVQVLYEVHAGFHGRMAQPAGNRSHCNGGDVMKLQGENRILVKEGLSRLGHTSNLGLRN